MFISLPLVPVLFVGHDVVAVLGGRQRALVSEPGSRVVRLAVVQCEVALVGQGSMMTRVTIRVAVRLATHILVRRAVHAFAAAAAPQYARWLPTRPIQHRPQGIARVEPGFVAWARSPTIHIRPA